MASANRSVVVSEVLWFLNSQFSKLPKNEISSIMGAFYTSDEVNAAKSLLVDFAKSMHADYIPVFTERKGVNKVRATIDDLLSLFTLLDVHKVELPCYAILDVKRIPAIDSKIDVDLSVVANLASLVNELRQQVTSLSDKVDMLTSRSSVSAATLSTTQGQSSVSYANVVSANNSWADRSASLELNLSAPQSFVPPPRPPQSVVPLPRPQRPVKYGSGQSTAKIKAIPQFLTCFVGRLDKDTTEEDLCSYLEDVGIKDVRCRKLDDKDGTFRTAAFRVSCRDLYKDLFYDESNWPDGAVLRDWVFRHRDG